MNTFQKALNIKPRSNTSPSSNGTFQATVIPFDAYEGESLYSELADYMGTNNVYKAESMVKTIEGFIMKELKEGKRLDFGLVSFFPKLSKALPTRDANPSREGIYLQGGVKARRPLSVSLAASLIPVNPQAKSRSVIIGTMDLEERFRFHGFRWGHEVDIIGKYINIDQSHEDEKIWIEKPVKHRRDQRKALAYARCLEGDKGGTEVKCIFEGEPVKPGNYMLCISTRGGNGLDWTLNTVRHQIKIVV